MTMLFGLVLVFESDRNFWCENFEDSTGRGSLAAAFTGMWNEARAIAAQHINRCENENKIWRITIEPLREEK